MKKHTLYIAYGSNLNIEQMAVRCPDAEAVGKGGNRRLQAHFQGVGRKCFCHH